MSGFICTVLYPNEEDATFDMDYYLKTHMPMVLKQWAQHGLQSYTVIKFIPGSDGSRPPYSVQATLQWKDREGVEKALAGEEQKIIFGDVKNFSNKGPVFMGGDVVGTS